MFKYLNIKMNKGFTLSEILIAITVFTLVSSVAFGFFNHIFQSQKKVLAYQELFDQTSFVMEYMTRSIRMAKKQRIASPAADPINCITTTGRNYEVIANNHIRFIRHDGTILPPARPYVCYEFRLHSIMVNDIHINQLKVSRDRGVTWTPLTSPNLNVVNLRFRVDGDGFQMPALQPRVTIILEVRGREYGFGKRSIIHLQTTVSQRDLDIQ